MPKRSSTKPKERDVNLTAFRVVQEATDEECEESAEPAPEPEREKNPAAVALGRLGGKKGGKARAEALTSKRRSEIAKRAAETRWKKEKGESGK